MEEEHKLIPPSFHLQWHITERCNLSCKHCYFNKEFTKNELSFEQLTEIFYQYLEITEKWEIPRENNLISISGGEPLVREDLFDLLGLLKKHRGKLRYGLMSNGTLITKPVAKKLKKLGIKAVQISLEGVGETNDKIRGKGSFKKAERGIDMLINQGIAVLISTTITKENLTGINELIGFCIKKGINYLGIRRFVPIGRGKAIKDKMLEPLQVRELYLSLLQKNRELQNKGIKLHIMFGCEDSIIAQEKCYEPHGCNAGYYSFSILPNGDVYACRRLPILLGNILKDGFYKIYYHSDAIKRIRASQKPSNACQNCEFWNKCLGGAKCISYGYFGSLNMPDPQCWKIFKKLP